MTIDMTKAWQAFRDGDPISDEELIAMMLEAETALHYLEHRGEAFSLATSRTRLDLESLQDFARARGLEIGSLDLFPVYPDLLRADGMVDVHMFTVHVTACVDKFAAVHRGEHHTPSIWNRLFRAHLMTTAVEAIQYVTQQKKPTKENPQ
jgi:hypothetical protein